MLDAGDTDIARYTWDARNRLTEVRDYANYATLGKNLPTQVVDYIYDVENRWIGKNIDSNGDGLIDHQTRFAYDGNQIVLQFDRGLSQFSGTENGTVPLTVNDLSHRYLWGPAVDQLLADEQLTNVQSPGRVVWPLTDNLGTVRDLAVYDAQNGTTSVANHRTFDSFGNLKSQTNAAVDSIFGWTGRPVSKATGLQNNLNRWYDPIVAGWMSQDPIGFKSGTTNLYCYCGNSPTNATDPTGLWVWPWDPNAVWVWPFGSSPPPIPNPPPGTIAVAGQVAKYVAQKGMPPVLGPAVGAAQAGVGANVIGQVRDGETELAIAVRDGRNNTPRVETVSNLHRTARPYFPP